MSEPTKTPHHHELRRAVILEYRQGPVVVEKVFKSSFQLFKQLEKLAHLGGRVEILTEITGPDSSRFLTARSRETLNLYLRGMQGLSCWQRATGGGFVHTSRHGWSMFCAHLSFEWINEEGTE